MRLKKQKKEKRKCAALIIRIQTPSEGLKFGNVALATMQGNGERGLKRERERKRRWWYMACEREDGSIWRVREIRGNFIFDFAKGVLGCKQQSIEILGAILSFQE